MSGGYYAIQRKPKTTEGKILRSDKRLITSLLKRGVTESEIANLIKLNNDVVEPEYGLKNVLKRLGVRASTLRRTEYQRTYRQNRPKITVKSQQVATGEGVRGDSLRPFLEFRRAFYADPANHGPGSRLVLSQAWEAQKRGRGGIMAGRFY
jgi:hypothetical protein